MGKFLILRKVDPVAYVFPRSSELAYQEGFPI